MLEHAKPQSVYLVELLVVIGIIALRISILLPALNSPREQARTVQCLSNLRQLGQAAVLYTTETKGYVLPSDVFENLGDMKGRTVRGSRSPRIVSEHLQLTRAAAGWVRDFDRIHFSEDSQCSDLSNWRWPWKPVTRRQGITGAPPCLSVVSIRLGSPW